MASIGVGDHIAALISAEDGKYVSRFFFQAVFG